MGVNWEEECRSLRIDIRELRALSVGQQAEIEQLRAVLEWYASRERTREQYIWDDGVRARKALEMHD